MEIVHVAVVSGCLLASNNPSTTTALVSEILPQYRNDGTEHQVQTKSQQTNHSPKTVTAVVSEMLPHSRGDTIQLQAANQDQNAQLKASLIRATNLPVYENNEDEDEDREPKDVTSWKMSPVYTDTPFLPVSLWDRGRMKRAWIENTEAYEQNEWFKQRMEMSVLRFSTLALA
jgi:hypothetical protein